MKSLLFTLALCLPSPDDPNYLSAVLECMTDPNCLAEFTKPKPDSIQWEMFNLFMADYGRFVPCGPVETTVFEPNAVITMTLTDKTGMMVLDVRIGQILKRAQFQPYRMIGLREFNTMILSLKGDPNE